MSDITNTVFPRDCVSMLRDPLRVYPWRGRFRASVGVKYDRKKRYGEGDDAASAVNVLFANVRSELKRLRSEWGAPHA